MEGIINVKDYESLTHQGSDWTEGFRTAVAEAVEMGGGTVYVPPGTYATRSIRLYSNMTLYLEAGAELSFSGDIENYELVDTEYEGSAQQAYMACIYADHAHHVAVKGDGVINGNGSVWWKALWEGKLVHARPYLINMQYCEHVRIEGVTLLNSPAWTVHPLYCSDVVIQGISICNPADSPNTDGINPDGCSHVRIQNCQVDVGDDCITLKSGTEKTPGRRPCENISISNCHMLHGHGGLVIGSEMSGDVRNVTVENCVFQDTDRGIRVKTRRRRGGTVENVHLDNIVMDRVMCPFVFNMYYHCGAEGKEKYVWDKETYPVDAGTPCLRNIHISNMTVTEASVSAGFIYGLKEQPVENVTFSHISVTMNQKGKPGVPAMMGDLDPVSAGGFFLRNGKGILFERVRLTGVKGREFDADESVDMEIL